MKLEHCKKNAASYPHRIVCLLLVGKYMQIYLQKIDEKL